MSIAYPFQIEGCSGEFSSEINGYMFTATIKLFEVTGGDDLTQCFNSLVDNNVPLVGTDLSGIDLDLTGCWLRNVKSTPLGDHQWRVVIQYQHSPFNSLSRLQVATQTQVSQVEANKDKDGNPVNTRYLYPVTYGGSKPTQREEELRGAYTDLQGGTFSKLAPESTRVYTTREAEDGDVIAREYVATVNNATWQSGAAGTWILSSITGATDDSQQTPVEWVNSYTFQYRSDGWDAEVVHTDENTNEPVPDPATSYAGAPDNTNVGSIVTVSTYGTKDFTDLFPATDV
jgi:hypothetical protein